MTQENRPTGNIRTMCSLEELDLSQMRRRGNQRTGESLNTISLNSGMNGQIWVCKEIQTVVHVYLSK